MSEIIRLLYTPINEFSLLDTIGAIILVLIAVSFVMLAISALQALIGLWRGEK